MNTHLQLVAVHTETTNNRMRVYVFDDAHTTRCTAATKKWFCTETDRGRSHCKECCWFTVMCFYVLWLVIFCGFWVWIFISGCCWCCWLLFCLVWGQSIHYAFLRFVVGDIWLFLMCILRGFVVGVVVLFGVGAVSQDIISHNFTRLSYYCTVTCTL